MQQENTRRQLLGNSAVIFGIRAIPAAASVLSAVLLSRMLPAVAYGQYQAYWSQILLLSSLACIGLPSLFVTLPAGVSLKFIPENVAVKAAIGAALTLAAILLWIFGADIATPLTGFVLLTSIALGAVAEALLLQVKKEKSLLWINALYASLFLAAHLFLLKGFLTFRSLFALISILSLLKLGASFFLLSRHRPALAATGEPDKNHFTLWGHLAFYDATQYIFKWIDKAILAVVLPPALFAVYFNGTYDVPFLPLLLGAAGSTLLMHLSRKTHGTMEQAKLQGRAALMMSYIVFPAFFFLALFRNELFSVIFTKKYADAAGLFLVAILVLPLRTYNFTTLLQHAGKGRVINAGALLDLLIALALMWPLYKLWHLRGVALAFVISTYVQAAFYLLATSRTLLIPLGVLMPYGKLLIRLIVFGVGYILLYYLLKWRLSPRAVLFLGAFITGLVVAIPLLRERFRK